MPPRLARRHDPRLAQELTPSHTPNTSSASDSDPNEHMAFSSSHAPVSAAVASPTRPNSHAHAHHHHNHTHHSNPPDPTASAGSLSKVKRVSPPHAALRQWPRALACALSIMCCLMGYSILQERIMTRPYVAAYDSLGPAFSRPIVAVAGSMRESALLKARKAEAARDSSAAFFSNSLFLVLANRLLAATVTAALIAARHAQALSFSAPHSPSNTTTHPTATSDLKNKAPLIEYAYVSLSNVIATSCQYEALKWLTFPTVTIGKCAKMLPVMIILNMRSGRRYSYHDFGIVAVVLCGCAIMISSGNVAARRSGTADVDTPIGFFLMIVYLLFDAVTSTYQERLFVKYDMTVQNQMLYINITSSAISLFGLSLSGSLFSALRFVMRYPAIWRDIVMLSITAVAGQFAISYTIHSFGALLYAGIMTTRQFCSVLASDIIFKHGLTATQWTGALMVFSALFYKLWRKAVQSVE